MISDKEKELQNKVNELELTLSGVMWFVDKWLDGKDLEKDEVTRAMLMREKSLKIVEELDRKIHSNQLHVEKLLADIEKHIITNDGVDWEWFDNLKNTWKLD